MPTAVDYVQEFGNVPFSEKPFCDADNIALCGVFYAHVENVLSDEFEENPKTLGQVAEELFAYNNHKHIAYGLILPKSISKRLTEMGKQPRYKDLKITACRTVYSIENTVQFAAVTVILPDNTAVILYRGTDDTLTGWIEDFDLLLKKGIPSHKLSLDYLNYIAAKHDGNIILAGHSKGGNIALYAAINCSDEIRERITKVYNNDGPGFYDYSNFRKPSYNDILPKYRHIIPKSSFVGMLLRHDNDYTVVDSKVPTGLLQHDIASWQIKDGEIVTLPELSFLGKLTDISIDSLLTISTWEQFEAVYEILCSTLESSGQTSLMGMAKNLRTTVKGIVNNWGEIEDDVKSVFYRTVGMIAKTVFGSVKEATGKAAEAPEAQPETTTETATA